MFSFHLSSHNPSFMMLWHEISISFHMKELPEAKKIDRMNGQACQDKWRNACSSNLTIRMVNKRISVNYCAVKYGMFLVYVCVETCLLVLVFGHIAADQTRPDQTHIQDRLQLTPVETIQLATVFFPMWRVLDWTVAAVIWRRLR